MSKKIDPRFEQIVKEKDIFPTLKEAKSDRLDFTEVSKWCIADLMEKAYELGKKDGIRLCNSGA